MMKYTLTENPNASPEFREFDPSDRLLKDMQRTQRLIGLGKRQDIVYFVDPADHYFELGNLNFSTQKAVSADPRTGSLHSYDAPTRSEQAIGVRDDTGVKFLIRQEGAGDTPKLTGFEDLTLIKASYVSGPKIRLG